MERTSRLSDIENRVYLDKISSEIRNLNPPFASTPFLKQMVRISSLLSNYDGNLDDSFPFIDDNTRDPTYFMAAYFDTRNIVEALWIYRIVRSLTRYILLLDRFYETRNTKYSLLARQIHKSVNELLQSESDAQHLIYSMDYLLAQFSVFWKFEQVIKNRILKNYTFSYTEIRHFNLSKSSDAPLVYAKVLEAKLPSFNENVALILHYNQALLDIQDDWDDIEDDIREDMPNIFVMAAVNNIPYDRIKKSDHDAIRKFVLNGTTTGLFVRLIDELQASSQSISLPDNFAFLKFLSERYANNLRGKLSTTNTW
jgi:hypothetical protein